MPERLRCDDSGLRRDQRVVARQEQVTLLGLPHRFSSSLAEFLHAREREVVEPTLVVGQEEPDHRRFGDERLVVARPGQGILRRLIVHLDDRVEHHVARGRRARRVACRSSSLSSALIGRSS